MSTECKKCRRIKDWYPNEICDSCEVEELKGKVAQWEFLVNTAEISPRSGVGNMEKQLTAAEVIERHRECAAKIEAAWSKLKTPEERAIIFILLRQIARQWWAS